MNKKMIIALSIILLIIIGIIIFVYNKVEVDDIRKKEVIDRQYYVLESNGEQGIIDKKGNVLIKPQYVNIVIPDFSKPIFFVYDEKSEIKVINDKSETLYNQYENKEPVLGANYDIENQYRPVIKFSKDEKYGLLNLKGKVILPPIYDDITSLNNDVYTYKVRKDGKVGLANSKGKIILKPVYSDIIASVDDLGVLVGEVKDNYGFKIRKLTNSGQTEGYSDFRGKILLKPKYQEVKLIRYGDNKDSLLKVKENGKFGYYRGKKQILPPIYQELNPASKSIVYKKDNKYGLIAKDGRELLAARFDSYKIINNYIEFTSGSDEQVFNEKGEKIDTGIDKMIDSVPNTSYVILETFSGERLAKDLKNPDKTIKNGYLELVHAFDDKFVFFKNEKYGLASIEKGEILEPKFEYISVVSGTKILEAKEGEDYKLFDSEGKIIDGLENPYLQIISDKPGKETIVLSTETDKRYYNHNGEESTATEVMDRAFYPFKEDGKWGFKSKLGKVIVKPEYDMVGDFNKLGFAGIKKDGKWGSVNLKGDVILEPIANIGERVIPEFVGEYMIDDVTSIFAVDIRETELDYSLDGSKKDSEKDIDKKDVKESKEKLNAIDEKQEEEYDKAQKQKQEKEE